MQEVARSDGQRKIDVCVVIPIYDNPETIQPVVESLRGFGLPCIVVDDGSGEPTQRVLGELERENAWVHTRRLPTNSGKGAAVIEAFRAAIERGHTHAIQIDADGQHDARDVPRFLEVAETSPDALVLGKPRFDDTAPAARKHGRKVTTAFLWLETLSRDIGDGLCGFRCYPLAAVEEVLARARLERRMGFDIEIAARLHWVGTPVVNLETCVAYPPGGVSHFHYLRDNLHISRTHTKLILGMLLRSPWLVWRRLRQQFSHRPRPQTNGEGGVGNV